MVCKRACYEPLSGMSLEEEVVDLSGDESEQWWGECVRAWFQENAMCEVVVSDSNCDFV